MTENTKVENLFRSDDSTCVLSKPKAIYQNPIFAKDSRTKQKWKKNNKNENDEYSWSIMCELVVVIREIWSGLIRIRNGSLRLRSAISSDDESYKNCLYLACGCRYWLDSVGSVDTAIAAVPTTQQMYTMCLCKHNKMCVSMMKSISKRNITSMQTIDTFSVFVCLLIFRRFCCLVPYTSIHI